MLTTVGQVLVNDALPPRFRDYGRVMDSKGIEKVLEEIAREAPGEYAGVTKVLGLAKKIGANGQGVAPEAAPAQPAGGVSQDAIKAAVIEALGDMGAMR